MYNMKVSALGTRWVVPKRFSELELLNDALRKQYAPSRLPKFPSKGGLGGLFRRLDDSTIEKRRSDLQTYFQGALANSRIYKSQLLRLFFEMPRGIAQAHQEASELALVRARSGSGSGSSGSSGSSRSSGMDDCRLHPNEGHDNFSGGNNRMNYGNTNAPKPIVLFVNQPQPVPSLDHQGMRLAIKNSDIVAVQNILKLDQKLARYVDASGQSMLHLACIFSCTDIAMVLLDVGADPELKNSHGETSFDLAPPALAQKMMQFIEAWEDSHS